MTGMFQRAREEGRTEGVQLGHIAGQQQGHIQGRMEGERRFLERQLRRKFGTLSSVVDARLSKASATDLEAWGDNVLDADSVDEVFNPH